MDCCEKSHHSSSEWIVHVVVLSMTEFLDWNLQAAWDSTCPWQCSVWFRYSEWLRICHISECHENTCFTLFWQVWRHWGVCCCFFHRPAHQETGEKVLLEEEDQLPVPEQLTGDVSKVDWRLPDCPAESSTLSVCCIVILGNFDACRSSLFPS